MQEPWAALDLPVTGCLLLDWRDGRTGLRRWWAPALPPRRDDDAFSIDWKMNYASKGGIAW